MPYRRLSSLVGLSILNGLIESRLIHLTSVFKRLNIMRISSGSLKCLRVLRLKKKSSAQKAKTTTQIKLRSPGSKS